MKRTAEFLDDTYYCRQVYHDFSVTETYGLQAAIYADTLASLQALSIQSGAQVPLGPIHIPAEYQKPTNAARQEAATRTAFEELVYSETMNMLTSVQHARHHHVRSLRGSKPHETQRKPGLRRRGRNGIVTWAISAEIS